MRGAARGLFGVEASATVLAFGLREALAFGLRAVGAGDFGALGLSALAVVLGARMDCASARAAKGAMEK